MQDLSGNSGITQLADMINPHKFRDIIIAGIDEAERHLDDGDRLLATGQFDMAEESWKKAWSNLNWIALNVIQRRLRVGKNEGAEVRKRLREFWRRTMIFGLKRRLAAASA